MTSNHPNEHVLEKMLNITKHIELNDYQLLIESIISLMLVVDM